MRYTGYNDRKYGITDQIDDTYLQLDKELDDISKILNNIDLEVNNMRDYFTGYVADAFFEKNESYRRQTDTIRENLKNYAKDLLTIKEMYKNIDTNAVHELQGDTDTIKDNTNKVTQDLQDKESNTDLSASQIGATQIGGGGGSKGDFGSSSTNVQSAPQTQVSQSSTETGINDTFQEQYKAQWRQSYSQNLQANGMSKEEADKKAEEMSKIIPDYDTSKSQEENAKLVGDAIAAANTGISPTTDGESPITPTPDVVDNSTTVSEAETKQNNEALQAVSINQDIPKNTNSNELLYDSNGYLIRDGSGNAQHVVNGLIAHPVNSKHSAELDQEIDNLTPNQCVWVLSRLENEAFGQTGDGYYKKSVESDQNFVKNQVNKRYGGDIHNLLKHWGTYSYSGY